MRGLFVEEYGQISQLCYKGKKQRTEHMSDIYISCLEKVVGTIEEPAFTFACVNTKKF